MVFSKISTPPQKLSSGGTSILPSKHTYGSLNDVDEETMLTDEVQSGVVVSSQSKSAKTTSNVILSLMVAAILASVGVVVLGTAWKQASNHLSDEEYPSVSTSVKQPNGWDDNTFFLWEQFLMTKSANLVPRANEAPQSEVSLVSYGQETTFVAETTATNPSLLYFNQSAAFGLLNLETDDFFKYQSGWEAQITQALCAVATTSAVLNSLRDSGTKTFQLPMDPIYVPFHWATQSNLLDVNDEEHGDCILSAFGGPFPAEAVRHIGQGLKTLVRFANCFLNGNGYHSQGYPAVESQKDAYKAMVIQGLQDPNSRVLLNYDRGGISQGPMGHGHWSPLGAYNPSRDSFLVMDVAKYKHPMVWVTWEDLWKGVLTVDSCSNMKLLPTTVENPKIEDWSKVTYHEVYKTIAAYCEPGYRGFVIVKPFE